MDKFPNENQSETQDHKNREELNNQKPQENESIWNKFKYYFKKIWRRFQLTKWVILAGMTFILVMSGYLTFLAKTADVSTLKAGLQTTTTIYDVSSEKAGSISSQKGTYVDLDKISIQIQNAVISTEDKRFYQHHGFDVMGILRAAFNYVRYRGPSGGGGSTLTQQLAKNAFLTQKQTFSRKAEELFLAIEIEKEYSKKDILAMYLNNAYFGNGVWGVQDASQKYFGKNAADLTSGEGATLAGILKGPSYYNPIDQMKNAISRRNLILDLMVDNDKLSKTDAQASKAAPIALNDTYQTTDENNYPYYFDSVIDEAINKYGLKDEDVMNKGYKIYTSLNQNYQKQMQKTFETNWLFGANAADGTKVQGASIAVDPKTGGVLAVVGGREETTGHVFRGLNRATQIERQPGSIMKPLAVYTSALESGYSIDSVLKDEKLSYGSDHYTPENYDFQYSGEVPMYTALAKSLNAPAVWLLDQIGLNKGYSKVEDFGIHLTEDDRYLGLALGGLTKGVSPMTMASAYTVFANKGVRTDSHFITKIVDATGNVIVDNTEPKTKRVTSEKVANQMTSMMLNVYNNGTGAAAKPYGYTIAGKTGSTETTVDNKGGYRDKWMMAYTPDIVVSTWLGYDNTDATHFLTGADSINNVFKNEMSNILPYTPKTSFEAKDASVLAQEKAAESSNDWSSGVKEKAKEIGEGISKGAKNIKDKATEWFNNWKATH